MTLGRFDQSLACFAQSLRRNPLAPNSFLLAVGLIEYHSGNYGQSSRALSRMTGNQVQRASMLAAACAQAGYDEAARAAVKEFERASTEIPFRPRPDDGAGWMPFWRRVFPYLEGETFEHLCDGLGKAGLPV